MISVGDINCQEFYLKTDHVLLLKKKGLSNVISVFINVLCFTNCIFCLVLMRQVIIMYLALFLLKWIDNFIFNNFIFYFLLT